MEKAWLKGDPEAGSVRPARVTDLKAILDLYQQLNPNYPPPNDERAEEIWRELLGRAGVTVFVADHDGRPIATCTLIVVPNLTRSGRPYAVIENVVTRSDFHRRGYGRKVIETALAAAWASGCYKTMLLSGRPERSGVPAFYESVGFRRGIKTGYEAHPPA